MKKDIELITKVAKQYHQQGWSQERIAKNLFLSRSKISRILTCAKEIGIVEIVIREKIERNTYLENEFKKRYKLKDILISKTCQEQDNYDVVTGMAAAYFDVIVSKGDIVGISRGETMNCFVKQFKVKKDMPIDVVQLIGSMEWATGNFNEMEVVHDLASAYNGRSHYLLSPFAAQDVLSFEALKNIGANKAAVDLAMRSDIIITSVGAKKSQEITAIWNRFLSERDRKTLNENQAVGVLGGNYFNKQGEIIRLDITEQVVGLDVDTLLRLPTSICVATGIEKVEAIVGALRAGLFNILITDQDTALEVLIEENR